MFKRISKYNLSFIFLLIIFLIINSKPYDYLMGENGFLEITQCIFLTLGIIVNVKHLKILSKNFRGWIVKLKIFFFLFILYEELSILSTDSFQFLKSINNQAELNLHNASFLTKPLFSLNIFNDDMVHFIPLTALTLITLLIIGFGSYIKLLDKINYFFLEKRFSFYVLIYPLNFGLSYFLRPFITLQNGFLIDQEFVELFFYLILFLDSQEKVNLVNKKSK